MRETHHWGELRIQGALKRLQGANIKAHYCKPGICTFRTNFIVEYLELLGDFQASFFSS